jgi:Aerotolerance regulator N-terminal
MTFKQPEILAFLLLLLVPIVVHLFQLRRFKTEFFTNVKFLKELSAQTRKSATIKKWLLLGTRLLLLLFLILAFAQPFFKSKDNKNVNNEMFIILDNSFSMQAKGKKGELLKRAVQELLENTPEYQQFSLLTNADNYWNTDIKSIQNELQTLEYTATPFVLDNLLSKINAHKTMFNKDIVIITDAIGLTENQLKSISKKDKTYFVIPKAELQSNVSIDSVFINQNLDNFYEIGLKLSNFNDNKVAVPVALYNKNKLLAKSIVSIENKVKTINFTIPKEDFQGYASIEDKGLEYDNKLFFSISKPEKTKVITIGETAKSDFLSRIFTIEEFDYQNFELAVLDYNLIENQDAIILNELSNIPQALQTTLKSFVEKGGNLIYIPSADCSKENSTIFLTNFGSLQFNTLQNSEKLITKINFSHPIFNTVFEKKIDNFQYPNTKSAFVINSAFAPILTFQDQNPFLISIENPISTVFVFAAPINKSNSNFQNSPLIVPTFYNMAKNNGKTGITNLIIGENKPFLVDVLLAKDQILNVKNEQENFIPTQQILNNKVKLNFNDYPEKAGNFEIYNQEKSIKNISFNYNRTESDLATNNTNLFSNYKILDNIETVFNSIHTDRTESQIWKLFVLLALICLIAEIFIQKFVK